MKNMRNKDTQNNHLIALVDAVTLFHDQVYIHVKHRYRKEKTVSLTMNDFKRLVDKYHEIISIVKKLKSEEEKRHSYDEDNDD